MINILFVRFPNNQLGDIICSKPMFAALKNKYPNSHITLITAETNYPVPYKILCPEIDEVFPYTKKSLKDIFRFYKIIRKRKYDIGIIPSNIKLSRTSHIINFFSGAKVRVGVNSINGIENKSSFLLNLKSDFHWNLNETHQVKRGLEIIKQLGINYDESILDSLKIIIPVEILNSAKMFLEKSCPDKTRKIFAFHPGAGKTENIWNGFPELIEELYKRYNSYILISSGTIDKEIIESLETILNKKNIPFILLHQLEIMNLAAIFSQIERLFTNDTGTMHLAAYCGTKVTALFGPTNPGEWAPLVDNILVIKSPSTNINEIKLAEVINNLPL